MGAVLRNIATHPRIDGKAIAGFVAGTVMTKVADPNRVHYTQGYDPGNTSQEPIRHGLALRLFIPFRDAQILDARIDGRAVKESATDGYLVRRDPGTIVQFNIPPGQVGALHVVTCRYQSDTKHQQGFAPKDWE